MYFWRRQIQLCPQCSWEKPPPYLNLREGRVETQVGGWQLAGNTVWLVFWVREGWWLLNGGGLAMGPIKNIVCRCDEQRCHWKFSWKSIKYSTLPWRLARLVKTSLNRSCMVFSFSKFWWTINRTVVFGLHQLRSGMVTVSVWKSSPVRSFDPKGHRP